MRFDVLNNTFSFDDDKILDFIDNQTKLQKPFMKNIFMGKICGLDNVYIGNINTMYKLIYHFHCELDDILKKYITYFQEFLVYYENDILDYN